MVAGAWKEMAHDSQGDARPASGDLRSNLSNPLPGSSEPLRVLVHVPREPHGTRLACESADRMKPGIDRADICKRM